MESVRLNKYLASCGICSRRDADKLIEQGVVCVNGAVAQNGTKVTEKDTVTVRGKKVGSVERTVVLAYYKPIGVTCTERDPHAKKIITDEIKYPIRVTYAGRLDKDSEGLILMTNNGDLINAMMKGANRHEKEYVVKVSKEWTPEVLETMRNGVYLKELDVTTRPCSIEQVGPKTIKMILTQGLNRQIRRMCQSQGFEVTSLKRTRVIDVKLADLKPGEYRELHENEIDSLYQKVGLKQ